MTSLRLTLIAACIFSGLLAGASIDRYIVQVPAWRHMDMLAWLDYSRHADLANGLLLYPVEAVGAFIFMLAASFIVVSRKTVSRRFRSLLFIATALSALGLFYTFFAAPIMLGLRTIPRDPVMVAAAFDQFHFYGIIRAVAQVLSFLFCIAAINKFLKTVSNVPYAPN